jgi:hypothetical protein
MQWTARDAPRGGRGGLPNDAVDQFTGQAPNPRVCLDAGNPGRVSASTTAGRFLPRIADNLIYGH